MSVPARTPNLSMVPLGLFSLGVSVFLLSADFSHWIDAGAYIPYGIFTGGIGLLIAGIFALSSSADFGGAAFTLLGSFFVATGIYQWFFLATAKAPNADLGWVALAWTVVLLFLSIAVFNVPVVPGPGKVMWVALFLTFFFAWLAAAFGLGWAGTAASVVGIITAILAWIGGLVTLRGAASGM